MSLIARILIPVVFLCTAGAAGAEQISVLDANCERESIQQCMVAFTHPPPTPETRDWTGRTIPAQKSPDQSCIAQVKRSPKAEATIRSNYPDGCYDYPKYIKSIEYCHLAGKLNAKCATTITVMTPGDIKLIRDSFTEQLDAWLKMLEKAGAVDLSDKSAP